MEENAKINCKAVFISSGGILSERQFLRDYKDIVCEPFPHVALGRSVRSLLESWGEYRFIKTQGETLIEALPDPDTAHISALVRGQKKPKSKGRGRRPISGMRPRPPPRFGQSRQPMYQPSYKRSPPPPARISAKSSLPKPDPPRQRYSLPEIVPQRQPLSARLQVNTEGASNGPTPLMAQPVEKPDHAPSSSAVQNRLLMKSNGLGPQRVHTLDKPKVEERIKAVSSPDVSSKTEPKDSMPYEVPAEDADATFIDIQWLSGKIYNRNTKPSQPLPSPPLPVDNGITKSPSTLSSTEPSFSRNAKSSPPLPVTLTTTSTPSPLVNGTKKPMKQKTPDKVSGTIQQKVIFTSSIEELQKLAKELGLKGPEFKCIERRPAKSKPLFTAKCKIESEIYSSFPFESATKEEAMENVAKAVIERLTERYLSSPESTSPEQFDEGVMIDRIYSILENKSNGMFDHAIADLYREKFHVPLPEGWLSVIDQSPQFLVEELAHKNIIYPCQKGKAEVQDFNANNITVKYKTPPPLQLPTGNTWDVYVTSINSEFVYFRLIGEEYDALYNEVINDLELSMLKSNGKPVPNPTKGHYYAVVFDNCWLRVQLLDFREEGAEVLLVDNGDIEVVPLDNIMVLEDQFLDLPPQAVCCQLAFVDLSYKEAEAYILDNVLGVSFVAKVHQQESEESVLKLILYNTEGEDTININFCILEKILLKMEPPHLPQKGQIFFLKITHVEENEPLCVQVAGKDSEFLESILNDIRCWDLIKLHGVNAHPSVAHLNSPGGHMFIVRYSKAWHRGVISSADPKSPLVYFVDQGFSERVPMNRIFDLEKVLRPLCNFPARVIRVNLSEIPPSKLNSGIITRLQEIAPLNMTLMGKLTESFGNTVELFKRTMPDKIIASINSDLLFHWDEYSVMSKDEGKQDLPVKDPIVKKTRPSTYPINAEEAELDVKVTMSSNPFNFIVQPVRELAAFNNMMGNMQKIYETEYAVRPVPSIEELTDGCFAAKHPNDSQWYRVDEVKTLHDGLVTVRYCDYGDVGYVARDGIRKLDPEFMEIPSLAIKARIHGLQPKNGDWSVEDCLFFNKIVTNKDFVARVLEVNADCSDSTWRISIELIDTSGSTDINISHLLIKEGIADAL